MTMTSHMESIAFRIWQVAEPLGWDITIGDAAREAGVEPRWAGRAVRLKGWQTRFRSTKRDVDFLGWERPERFEVKSMALGMGWDQ